MATFPTNINLSDTTPPAKPDSLNVEWQGDAPVPDPNSPGTYVRNASACYRYPKVGGVQILTDDYLFSEVDSGFTFIVNSSSPVTITMPAAPPVFQSPAEGVWFLKIKNIGTGTVTLDPNGMNVDASTSTFTIPKGTGFGISTDNTDYYTFDNFGLSTPLVDTFTGDGSTTSFTLTKAPSQGFAFVFWNAGGGIVLPTDYSISGTTLTTSFKDAGGNSIAAQSGDKIYVVYFA